MSLRPDVEAGVYDACRQRSAERGGPSRAASAFPRVPTSRSCLSARQRDRRVRPASSPNAGEDDEVPRRPRRDSIRTYRRRYPPQRLPGSNRRGDLTLIAGTCCLVGVFCSVVGNQYGGEEPTQFRPQRIWDTWAWCFVFRFCEAKAPDRDQEQIARETISIAITFRAPLLCRTESSPSCRVVDA